MKVYLLRHAQTDMNKERRIQGRMNTLINEEGRRQAEKRRDDLARRGLRFDRIFASPLERALTTAEIVTGVPRSSFVIDERLAEIRFGELDGTYYKALPGHYANFFKHPGLYVPAEGGETFQELDSRLTSFFKDLLKDDFNGQSGNHLCKQPDNEKDSAKAESLTTSENYSVLLASHGTVIHSILKFFLKLDYDDFWTPVVSNCSFFEFDLTDGRYSLIGAYDFDGKLEPDWHNWIRL